MSIDPMAPWHKKSWDEFIQEGLPELLAERLPLAGYHVESTDTYACRLKVVLEGTGGEIELDYRDIPQPDEAGLFQVNGCYRVVVPVATDVDLEAAEIRCVGDLLLSFLSERLGESPDNFPWDASLARTWLPLDAWIQEFLVNDPTSQYLQQNNWLDMHTHIRRITLLPTLGLVTGSEPVFAASQVGRACLFCTPEGPNIGRILEVAQGAEIRDGRLVVVDEGPEGMLGMGASMVPFMEHNDGNRMLMGVNMMRQWIGPPGPEMPRDERGYFHDYQERYSSGEAPDPEPALVQTGNEPDRPHFWTGYNLLTAYISWDGDAYEDGIVISESCADRMHNPRRVEPGDKLSNRHGSKGVVSRILPDGEMPHLADGTPVDLVLSLSGLPSRMNFGQVREAVMGRIAQAEGRPAVVPPFRAPDDDELRARLKKAELPEEGMETLTVNGKELERPSTAGWVYWGRTHHLASDKICMSVAPQGRTQVLGEAEYLVLRESGAFETIRELFHTCSTGREDADSLAGRVASGPVDPADPPSAGFANFARRLEAGGVRAVYGSEGVTFGFNGDGETALARPVPHPWFPQQELTSLGVCEGSAEYEAVIEANGRLERMLKSGAPGPLVEKASAQLESRVNTFFETLLAPEHLRFNERVMFSGRTVIAPGADRSFDEVGLPEEMAWMLFGPLVVQETGREDGVRRRSKSATKVLDQIMARSWVVINRPASWVIYRVPVCRPIIAFRPVRCAGNAIRLPLLACRVMNADFDGDQVAVFLPLTEGAQREAETRLSLAAHLARQPELITMVHPAQDALLGLASLSLTASGEIEKIAGTEVGKFVTRHTLVEALKAILEREGPQKALETSERLMSRGFEVAGRMGASMNPFLGSTLDLPPKPESDDPEQWQAHAEEVTAWLASRDGFLDNDFGPLNLLCQSGARSSYHQLRQLLGAAGVTRDVEGNSVPLRHGWQEGLPPEEVVARVSGARRGLANVLAEVAEVSRELEERSAPGGYNALARARRSDRPGVVFARAAARSETDPLMDAYSRLFVGLPMEERR